MNKLVWIAVFLITFSSISFGANEIIATENIITSQDGSVTWRGDSGSFVYYKTMWNNLSRQKGIIGCTITGGNDVFERSYFEFRLNETINLDKVLSTVNLDLIDFSGTNKNVQFINNTGQVLQSTQNSPIQAEIFFSEAFNVTTATQNLTWNTKPADKNTGIFTGNLNQTTQGNYTLTDSNYINDQFYKNQTMYIGLKSRFDFSIMLCGQTMHNGYENYLNASNEPTLTLQFTDFKTDTSHNALDETGLIYFDFETGETQLGSSFDGADFLYTRSGNFISPIPVGGDITIRNTAFNTPAGIEEMESWIGRCYAPNIAPFNYTTDIRTEINVPQGSDVYCFNVSSEHGGREFYGIIQVVNVTEDNFDFFYGLAGPNLTEITNVFHLPANPLSNQSVTVFWQSSQTVNSTLFYRFKKIGDVNFSNFNRLEGLGLTKNHSIIIDKENIVESNFYQYYVMAGTTNNTNSGAYYNFSVGIGQRPEYLYNESYIRNITETRERLPFGVPNTETYIFLFGVVILAIFTIAGFWFGGYPFGLGSFFGGTALLTAIGFLPSWLLTPLLIITALIVANWIKKGFSD